MTSAKETKRQLLEGGGMDLGDLLVDDARQQLASLAGAEEAGDEEDPIGEIDYENLTNEEATRQETSALLEAFKARASAEKKRFELATDTEYWVGLCFQTREQKEAFLRAANLLQTGDKYIDGRLLAKRMGIALPAADVPYNVSARPDAKLTALVK